MNVMKLGFLTYDKGKLIVLDVDGNNFHENDEDLGKIIIAINAEIHGLFLVFNSLLIFSHYFLD